MNGFVKVPQKEWIDFTDLLEDSIAKVDTILPDYLNLLWRKLDTRDTGAVFRFLSAVYQEENLSEHPSLLTLREIYFRTLIRYVTFN